MLSIPNHQTPVLIVDDDIGLLLSIKATLVSAGMPEPALVSDSRKVIDLVRHNHFRLILLDLIMPHVGGMDLLQSIKQEFPDIECVIVTAIDKVSSAVKSIKFGAYDYLVKPLSNEKLTILISRALERYSLRRELSLYEKKQSFTDLQHPEAFKGLIAEDEALALIFHQVETMAVTDYHVVITGESGTGKERVADIIHRLSHRSQGPFIAVNMAAGCKTLFEDEFFGHEKGAYTGAIKAKKGFFETAQAGTLFLDEIADLPLELQGKLLRVIEEGELYRLGSSELKNVDVRIIAATNRDIEEQIRKEHFRADLFYRLNICHINIPPLRERKKDILPLARYFLSIHADKNNKPIKNIDPELSEQLLHYPFPGNVRELEHVITAAVLAEKSPVLTLASAAKMLRTGDPSPLKESCMPPLAEMEKQHILQVLKSTHGNRTRAAKILGIGLRTLQRKLKESDAALIG